MQVGEELDLKRLIEILLKKIKLIIIITLICGIATFIVTRLFITPMYTATASIYVNNTKGMQSNRIDTADLSAAQQLVNTYIEIIKSDSVLGKVSSASGLGYSVKDIRKMMKASAVSETEIFQVAIENAEPEIAVKLVNTIAKVAPENISRFVEGSSVKIIDYAKIPTVPSSPNTLRNTIIGFLLGLVLSVAIVLLMELLDVRIKSAEDLEHAFNIPVLGVIPDFNISNQNTKGYGYYEAEIHRERGKQKS